MIRTLEFSQPRARDWMPSQGTNIPPATWPGQSKKMYKKYTINNHNFFKSPNQKTLYFPFSKSYDRQRSWVERTSKTEIKGARGQQEVATRLCLICHWKESLLKIVQSHLGLGWEHKVTTTSRKRKIKEIHKNPQNPPQTAIIEKKLAHARNTCSSARAYCRRGRRSGLGAWGWNFRGRRSGPLGTGSGAWEP